MTRQNTRGPVPGGHTPNPRQGDALNDIQAAAPASGVEPGDEGTVDNPEPNALPNPAAHRTVPLANADGPETATGSQADPVIEDHPEASVPTTQLNAENAQDGDKDDSAPSAVAAPSTEVPTDGDGQPAAEADVREAEQRNLQNEDPSDGQLTSPPPASDEQFYTPPTPGVIKPHDHGYPASAFRSVPGHPETQAPEGPGYRKGDEQ